MTASPRLAEMTEPENETVRMCPMCEGNRTVGDKTCFKCGGLGVTAPLVSVDTTESLERLARIDESAEELDKARLNLATLTSDRKDAAQLVKDLTKRHEKIVRERPGPLF